MKTLSLYSMKPATPFLRTLPAALRSLGAITLLLSALALSLPARGAIFSTYLRTNVVADADLFLVDVASNSVFLTRTVTYSNLIHSAIQTAQFSNAVNVVFQGTNTLATITNIVLGMTNAPNPNALTNHDTRAVVLANGLTVTNGAGDVKFGTLSTYVSTLGKVDLSVDGIISAHSGVMAGGDVNNPSFDVGPGGAGIYGGGVGEVAVSTMFRKQSSFTTNGITLILGKFTGDGSGLTNLPAATNTAAAAAATNILIYPNGNTAVAADAGGVITTWSENGASNRWYSSNDDTALGGTTHFEINVITPNQTYGGNAHDGMSVLLSEGASKYIRLGDPGYVGPVEIFGSTITTYGKFSNAGVAPGSAVGTYQAAVGQTANIFEIQSSNAVPLLTVSSNGTLTGTSLFLSGPTSISNDLALVGSGSDLTVDGKVGIGTTSPNSTLQIAGTAQKTAALTDAGVKGGTVNITDSDITSGAGSGGTLLFSSATANGVFAQAAIKSLLANGANQGQGVLAFSLRRYSVDTSLTERMRIDTEGNVGIGTTTPAAKLDVSGAIHSGSTNTTTPALVSMGTNNAVLRCPNGGSYILRIDNSGTISTVTNSTGL